MKMDKHFRCLERMYLSAPVNRFYSPTIRVENENAVIEIDVNPDMFHSGGGLHGSVYFKMLDDSAFFAVNSVEQEYFVLTGTFTVKLKRPVTNGKLRAVGKVTRKDGDKWSAESVLYNDDIEVGSGSGIFIKGNMLLKESMGYSS